VLHYNRERRSGRGWIECIFGKLHIADLAIKFENDRVLGRASWENTRNNFRNTLLAKLSLPMWDYTDEQYVTNPDAYDCEDAQDTWGFASESIICSRSCGSSQSTKGSEKVGKRPVARLWKGLWGLFRRRNPLTCQQSVMNSSQNSARRFCVSAGVRSHRAQSRSEKRLVLSAEAV
jgi:hypothetical protein